MQYTQMNNFDEDLEWKRMFSFALYKRLTMKVYTFSNRLMQLEGRVFLHCKNAQLLSHNSIWITG